MTRRFRPIEPEEPAGAPAVIDVEGGEPEPCPECGEDVHVNRRLEMRRVPNPDGGRGAVMARIVVCGACGTALGPG